MSTRRSSLLVALLATAQLGLLGDPPLPACFLVGEDHFPAGATADWTLTDTDGDCPIAGAAGTSDLRRTEAVGLGCDGSEGIARFDPPVGDSATGKTVSGCAVIEYVGSGAGVGGTDPWSAPGIAFAVQPSGVAINYLYVACADGPTCGSLILGDGDEDAPTVISTGFGALSAGHSMAACWTGGLDENDVATLELRVWHFTGVVPLDPLNWPAPDARHSGCPIGYTDCGTGVGPHGGLAGITFHSGPSLGLTSGFMAVDDWLLYRGCESAGAAVFDEYQFPFNMR